MGTIAKTMTWSRWSISCTTPMIEEYKQGRKNGPDCRRSSKHAGQDAGKSSHAFPILETSSDKLIQIVLVGQPEFEQILNKKELRQLKQACGPPHNHPSLYQKKATSISVPPGKSRPKEWSHFYPGSFEDDREAGRRDSADH